MIVLFTDFGWRGPYVGQMKGVLARCVPDLPVVDLMHDAPTFRPDLAAYLLAALVPEFPPETVFVAVVDPGVGSERRPLLAKAGGCWLVGPDNGLLVPAARVLGEVEWWRIEWRPERLSASFHGRDLFVPVAAEVASGRLPEAEPVDPSSLVGADWPSEREAVIYADDYGNLITGLHAESLSSEVVIDAGGRRLTRARTFADRPVGEPFWYENSNGLVELAVARGSAAELLGLAPGDAIRRVGGGCA